MNEVNGEDWNQSTTLLPSEGSDYVQPGRYASAINVLQMYVVPLIVLIGFIGNTLSFTVFLVSPLKRISTSVYLAALAFSDTGFLACLGIGWLESLKLQFFHTEGICQLTVYASFVFSFTSVWFVNAFTTEMYIAVFHPMKSPKLSTRANARRSVCCISFVAAVIYIYTFWITKLVEDPHSGQKVCIVLQEHHKTIMIMSYVDTVLTLLVPFTMIIVMITRLLIHITKFYKTEQENMGNSAVSESNTSTPEVTHRSVSATLTATRASVRQANEAQKKLMRMLVVTVVVFLVLNLPSHAIKVQFLFRSHFSETTVFTDTEGLMQIIFQVLYYANFSINFFLYIICGRSFRSAFARTPNRLSALQCPGLFDCTKIVQRLTMKTKLTSGSLEQENGGQQHSRLVDIQLQDVRASQLPSLESQFVCQSPPCLLAFESERLVEEVEEK